jgi:hypothetical protein
MIRYTTLLLGLLAARVAVAADYTLSVDNAAPNVGETLAITIRANIAAGESCVALNQYLSFDPAKLELVAQSAGTAGVFVPDSRGLAAMNASGEAHAGAYSLAGGVSGSVTLGVFTFRAVSAGVTLVRAVAYAESAAPFGEVLYRTGGALVVPSTPGALTITIGGDDAFEAWRLVHFTAAQLLDSSVSGVTADPDGDGLSNWGEYRAGTDPWDAASCLMVNLPANAVAGSGKFVVSWSSVAAKVYTLQSTTNLMIEFTDLKTSIPATPTINVYTDTTATVKCRFYRVKVE